MGLSKKEQNSSLYKRVVASSSSGLIIFALEQQQQQMVGASRFKNIHLLAAGLCSLLSIGQHPHTENPDTPARSKIKQTKPHHQKMNKTQFLFFFLFLLFYFILFK